MVPEFDVRSAVGRHARTTAGLAPAGISGTRSTREECVRRASTSGLLRSVSLVSGGRRTPIGIRTEGGGSSVLRIVAKFGVLLSVEWHHRSLIMVLSRLAVWLRAHIRPSMECFN